MALVGRITSDVSEITKQQSRATTTFLYTAKSLTAEELQQLSEDVQPKKGLP